jgi:hypothetical protein
MIDKEKTIGKAILKYKTIYPISGKKSLNDSFFYLHGDILFLFCTKDKKIHKIKAVKVSPVIPIRNNRYRFLNNIYKFLTKPIKLSSLQSKQVFNSEYCNLLE